MSTSSPRFGYFPNSDQLCALQQRPHGKAHQKHSHPAYALPRPKRTGGRSYRFFAK